MSALLPSHDRLTDAPAAVIPAQRGAPPPALGNALAYVLTGRGSVCPWTETLLSSSYETSRERVVEAIADALRAGVTPTEAVRLSGYTREGVRKVARAAGIERA